MYLHSGLWWEDAGKKIRSKTGGSDRAPSPGTQWPGIRPAVLPGPDLTDLDAIFTKTKQGPIQKQHMTSQDPERWRGSKDGTCVGQEH